MDCCEERPSSMLPPRTSVPGMAHPVSVLLLAALLYGGAAQSWAAGTDRPPSASTRRGVQQPKSAPSALSAAAVIDPCVPSARMTQAKATITEPSRTLTAAWPTLLTRTKAQKDPSRADSAPGDSLSLGLWSSRISAPDSSDDVETSLALKRLIRQVHRITFNDKSSTQPSVPAAKPMLKAEPSAPPAARAEEVQVAPAEAAAHSTPETAPTLSEKARKALADLQRNPSHVRDPLETAELLFLSGRPGDAAPFYEEALRRTSPGTAASNDDRAWILFQLGNCLRETDAAKAQNSYAKLISEYPDSPWTEMARAGGRLLTWYQNIRPDQLVTPVR